MTEMIERLRKLGLGSADEDTMLKWDNLKSVTINDDGGTWPRECFESIVDHFAEACEEAADALSQALARIEELEKAGRPLSNAAFNISRATIASLDAYQLLSLKRAQEAWDAALSPARPEGKE